MNIIWIDRGIILTIIKYILLLYSDIINMKIYIRDDIYRNIISKIFPNLNFTNKVGGKTFYFNIREIVNKKDVIISYINNMSGKKFTLVPYYDINDPLIAYIYDKKYKKNSNIIKQNINNFSNTRKNNYYGNNWDTYIESYIGKKYSDFFNINNNYYISKILNTYLKYINNNNIVMIPILYNNISKPTVSKPPVSKPPVSTPPVSKPPVSTPPVPKPKTSPNPSKQKDNNYINIIKLLIKQIKNVNNIIYLK